MTSIKLPIAAAIASALGVAIISGYYVFSSSKQNKEKNDITNQTIESKSSIKLDGNAENVIVFPEEPFYSPFMEDNGKVRMGVRNLKPDDVWIDIGASYLDQMKLKPGILANHWDEVFVSRAAESTEIAKRETLDMIVAYICKFYPQFFKMQGDYIHNFVTKELFKVVGEKLDKDPLLIASLLVQEDFCILEQEGEGEGEPIILTAGCVCFPMRWLLSEKYLRELSIIHQPVQPFEKHLSNPVNRALRNLKAPIWRANWSLFDDLTSTLDLYTPTSSAERVAAQTEKYEVDEAGDKLFYRSERQTLSRLPRSNAILFTIRTIQYPLKALLTMKDKDKYVPGMINAMEVMDSTFREYKGANRWVEPAIQYLRKNYVSA